MTAVMLQVPVQAPAKPCPGPVPAMFTEFAFEYKLGQGSAEDPKAFCPIKPSDFYGDQRKSAWYAGRRDRRKQLGLRVHGLQRLEVRRQVVAVDD